MITVTKNPVDGSDITIVSGVIETVKITKLKAPDAYKNTHKASLKIGDHWINVGAYKSTVDSLTTQDANKNWIEVKEGQAVKFAVSPRVYQGKTYYDVKRTNIKIVNSDSVTTEAPVKNAEQSKQQSNTNTAGKGENASKVNTKRFYGVLKSIALVKSPDGGAFLEFVELDKNVEIGEPVMFVTKTPFIILEIGNRVNFKYIIEEDKNLITEIVKVYDAIQTVSQKTKIVTKSKIQDAPFGSKERQFKMSFGNMMNVASNTNLTEPEKIASFAIELFQPAADLRVKLINQYKDSRSDSDVGAKLGDALKVAASIHKNKIQAIIDFAEKYVHEHIRAEEKMKNILEGKFANTKDDVIQPPVQQNINAEPDFSEPPMDFDEFEDVPF